MFNWNIKEAPILSLFGMGGGVGSNLGRSAGFAPIDPSSQTWSSLFTVASGTFDQSPALAFNGLIQGDPNRLRTSANAVLVTMTLSTPVTVQQVKVYAQTSYDSTCTVTIGGVTYTSSSGSIHTFDVSGSFTRMTLVTNTGSGRTYMEGMEINGYLLVNP